MFSLQVTLGYRFKFVPGSVFAVCLYAFSVFRAQIRYFEKKLGYIYSFQRLFKLKKSYHLRCHNCNCSR